MVSSPFLVEATCYSLVFFSHYYFEGHCRLCWVFCLPDRSKRFSGLTIEELRRGAKATERTKFLPFRGVKFWWVWPIYYQWARLGVCMDRIGFVFYLIHNQINLIGFLKMQIVTERIIYIIKSIQSA